MAAVARDAPTDGSVARWRRLGTRSRVLRAGVLVAAAVALDVGLGWVARELDWPVFLDSIGTVVVGAVLGPVAGALTGAGADVLTGALLGQSEAYAFAITAAFVGWAAAFAATRGAFTSWYRAAGAGALTGLGAGLLSAPIAAYVFGRPTGSGMDYATGLLQQSGANVLQITTAEGLLADPADKAISFVAAWAVLLLLRQLYPRPGRGFGAAVRFGGYTAAVLVSLLAAVVTVVFRPALGDSVILVFFLAVLIAALAGARGPGLLSVAVGACVGVLSTTGALGTSPSNALGWVGIALFAVVATAMVFVIDDRERGRRALARTSRDLQESSARILAITHSVQEGLLAIDTSGRAVAANRHFYDLFPFPPEDIDDQTLESVRPAASRVFDDGAAVIGFLERMLRDPRGVETMEAAQVWPVPRDIVIICSPVLVEGRDYVGRLAVFRDVTRERQAEREKNEFFSAVSHELRTPLTSIKGYSEMILDGDAGEVNDEALEYIAVVHSNSERLVGLVNDLLDFQRLESGRVALRSEPVDLEVAVQQVSETMARLIAGKSQQYQVDLDPGARWLRADPEKVVQVLTNYVGNAYKYSDEGARIVVRSRAVGSMAEVEVCDTGMGISAADQQMLFTRFYRVDNSATKEIGGTGLGLSIVKQIVTAWGGEVSVSSEPDVGSTFGFTVPLLVDPPTPAETHTPDSAAPA